MRVLCVVVHLGLNTSERLFVVCSAQMNVRITDGGCLGNRQSNDGT